MPDFFIYVKSLLLESINKVKEMDIDGSNFNRAFSSFTDQ